MESFIEDQAFLLSAPHPPSPSSLHRLNMEVDLQSCFGSMSRDVHSCTHWLRLRNSPPPPSPHIWAHIRGRYWSTKIDDISLWTPASPVSKLSPFLSLPVCRPNSLLTWFFFGGGGGAWSPIIRPQESLGRQKKAAKLSLCKGPVSGLAGAIWEEWGWSGSIIVCTRQWTRLTLCTLQERRRNIRNNTCTSHRLRKTKSKKQYKKLLLPNTDGVLSVRHK
jgi:hypothetical protein